MEYIVHHRCRELSAAGDMLNLPYGTRLNTIGDFIATAEGRAICFTTSELAHRYMARNDDGRGLERGKVSWAIAHSRRERRSDDGRAPPAVHRPGDRNAGAGVEPLPCAGRRDHPIQPRLLRGGARGTAPPRKALNIKP